MDSDSLQRCKGLASLRTLQNGGRCGNQSSVRGRWPTPRHPWISLPAQRLSTSPSPTPTFAGNGAADVQFFFWVHACRCVCSVPVLVSSERRIQTSSAASLATPVGCSQRTVGFATLHALGAAPHLTSPHLTSPLPYSSLHHHAQPTILVGSPLCHRLAAAEPVARIAWLSPRLERPT